MPAAAMPLAEAITRVAARATALERWERHSAHTSARRKALLTHRLDALAMRTVLAALPSAQSE